MRGLKRKKDLKRLKRRIERLIFEEKFFLKILEVSKILKVARWTLVNLIKRFKIKTKEKKMKKMKISLIDMEDLLKFIKSLNELDYSKRVDLLTKKGEIGRIWEKGSERW
jgi:hypothetical protein